MHWKIKLLRALSERRKNIFKFLNLEKAMMLDTGQISILKKNIEKYNSTNGTYFDIGKLTFSELETEQTSSFQEVEKIFFTINLKSLREFFSHEETIVMLRETGHEI